MPVAYVHLSDIHFGQERGGDRITHDDVKRELIRPASEAEMPEQDIVTTTRRTEPAPFLLDLLDFMEEKIREAVADEASQAAAVSEAAGAVPLLRDRSREDDETKAGFMLVFDEAIYGLAAANWWAALGRIERPEFEKQAALLVAPQGIFAVLRAIAADTGNS
jgi:hypothetical protein